MWQFYGATFIWSWLWWIPVARLPAGSEMGEQPPWLLLCLLAGAYGPSVMGLVFTWRSQGRDGVRELLRKLVRWRVGWWLWALALVVPWAMMASGMLLLAVSGGSLGPPTWSRWVLLPVALLAAVPFGPLAEELGWRGYALPRLVTRFGASAASVVVGVLWTLWHVPLFWAPAGTTISGGPINLLTVGSYMVTLVAMSLLATWLMWRSGNALFLGVLVHVGFNVDMPLMPFRQTSEQAEGTAMALAAVGGLVLVGLFVVLLRGVDDLCTEERS